MTKILKISVIALSLIGLCTSCFNDNDSETVSYNYSNANVTAFSFSANSDVCDNLASYTFSIDNRGVTDPDLIEACKDLWQIDKWTVEPGIIFNPDSLPSGSEPDSITVSISYNSPKSVYFYQYDENLELKNRTDFTDTTNISFDDYAITRLEITAYDGYTNKSYFVKVNVHKLYGDTIVWKNYASQIFDPSLVVDQRVDTIGQNLYWYTELQDGTQQVRTANLDGDISAWSAEETLSGNLKLGSMLAMHNTLYAVNKDGNLVKSTDGKDWSIVSSSITFHNLLGLQLGVELDGKIIRDEYMMAIVKQGEDYHFAHSLDGINWELAMLNASDNSSILPANFPIDGYTMPISTAAQPKAGNVTSRIYLVGGTDKNGLLTNSTWSCDGKSWVEFPQTQLPAMQNASIVTYTREVDAPGTFWILQPGLMANGEVSRVLWFSENKGVTWKKLSREFSEMADTRKIDPIACGNAFFSTKNYNIYFFGGIDANGQQKSSIFGGQYRNLVFSKIR